ncbi:uncharacterized protein LOC114936534 [Nylanderia fulva]|uniref:uncharacterized protein LOC114936534 n=1 Tax=Nylanderia fulva TaxID=613905 RepID=UPI0010FB20C8|nr:uncharacterized protein LOC114936534 [Nylanderia fulva]
MSDCKITYLPEEMISYILNDNVLTIEDIINFRCVCKKFRFAAKYDKFLEKKLFQRWPYAKKKYESLKETKDGKNINFITEGMNSVIQLRNDLSLILFYDYYYKNKANQNYFDLFANVLTFENVMKFSGNIDEYKNQFLVPKRTHEHIDVLKNMFYIKEIKFLLTQFPQGIHRKSIERYCNIEMSHYEKLSWIRNELDRYSVKPEKKNSFWKKFVLS